MFPPPHRYFMPRDYFDQHGLRLAFPLARVGVIRDSVNPGWTTHHCYPWKMNAPPGTRQELDLFLLPGGADPRETLEAVLPYTHRDRLVRVEGFKTFSPHWHLAYTPQAMERGLDWTPSFKPVMKDIGIDIAMIMDFMATDIRRTQAKPDCLS